MPLVRHAFSGRLIKLSSTSRWVDSCRDLRKIIAEQYGCVQRRIILSTQGRRLWPADSVKRFIGDKQEMAFHVSTDAWLLPTIEELTIALVKILTVPISSSFRTSVQRQLAIKLKIAQGALGQIEPEIQLTEDICGLLDLRRTFRHIRDDVEKKHNLMSGELLELESQVVHTCENATFKHGQLALASSPCNHVRPGQSSGISQLTGVVRKMISGNGYDYCCGNCLFENVATDLLMPLRSVQRLAPEIRFLAEAYSSLDFMGRLQEMRLRVESAYFLRDNDLEGLVQALGHIFEKGIVKEGRFVFGPL